MYLARKGKMFCITISAGLERVPEEGEEAGTLFRESEIENSQGKIFSLHKIPFLHFFQLYYKCYPYNLHRNSAVGPYGIGFPAAYFLFFLMSLGDLTHEK